jgi:hypothetical protein
MYIKPVHIVWLSLALVTCSHTEEDTIKEKKLVKVGEFPAEMQENSGMTEYGNLLWNINDSDNEPVIYGFNKNTNTLDRKIVITGATNTDWEEISQDDQHLYVGDFGNNSGDRHDLRIYIIDKSELMPGLDSIPFSGLITFSYEDQTDFSSDTMNTPFDCEAFVVMADSLLLFTKDWQSEHTSIYTLPAKSGDYTARFRTRYDIAGLVTASAYNADKKELLLLGYNRILVPFIRVIPNFSQDNFSLSNGTRIDFINFLGTQAEGIAFSQDGSVYVSCEKSPLVAQTLFRAEF